MSNRAGGASRGEKIRNLIGVGILAAAFLWSAVHMVHLAFGPGSAVSTSQKRVVRFAHWQLEGGLVEALNDAARLYEKLHPDVRVEQIPIPERAYPQWVRTQLIGRTAPDLIESQGWENLIVRYFVPITDIIEKPNPYHSKEWEQRLVALLGDEYKSGPDTVNLEGVPWRDTYIDGMQGGYMQTLQDFYGMPLSVFTIRCYANRDLLKKAAGTTEPPQDLETFFKICQDIQAYAQKNNLKLVPIAGSKYTESVFRGKYWGMAIWDLLDKMDLNEDGWVDSGEQLMAFMGSGVDMMTDPNIRAGHEAIFDISRYFNPGFMAAERDQSVFLFAQGNAAMIATGTWDAGSLYKQVGGDFEILVFDFPIPRPNNPKFGPYIRYRLTEAGTKAGFPMAMTKFSEDPDLTVDFMHFLSSQKVNEWLNRRFRWFPATRGARTDAMLQAFEPKMEGVYKLFDLYLTGQTQLRYEQMYGDYISAAQAAPDHYERFIRQYWAAYRSDVFADFERNWANSYSVATQTEKALAHARTRAVRRGLTPEIQRNLSALALGQVRRMHGRAMDWYRYQMAKQAYENRSSPGAGP